MDIKIINPIEFPNWNDQISELPGSTIFHTSSWAQVLSESYGYKPRYFCTLNKGQLKNVIPLMEIDSFLSGKRGVSLPFSDMVNPLVDNLETFEKLFEALTHFAFSNGWRSISFRGGDKFLKSEHAVKSFINSFINLNESPLSLLKGFRANTRRNIRKAERSEMTTSIDNSRNGITSFYRLNCLTRKEHGLPPQPFHFFEKIHKYILATGNGFISLVLYHNRPISAVIFLNFNKTAIYKYGASDKRFLKLRPNNLSMWNAIRECSCKFKTLDLGRSETNHQGLLQYKRSWNAIETVIKYYKYNVMEKRFSNKKPFLNSSYFLFKHLPMPLLKIIGKIVSRHIG